MKQRELFEAPRSCNTGAQIPAHSFKVDWLEFTVKGVDPVTCIRSYLDLDPADFQDPDYSLQGYSELLLFGTVKVLFTVEKPERGTKVILSSSGLDEVGRNAVDIIRDVLADGGTFARIDVAIDDRYEFLDLDIIQMAIDQAQDVTHFGTIEPKIKYCRRTRTLIARGFNWGSRAGARFLRCYDKRLEQIHHQNLEDPGHWIRFELETKKRAALALAIRLADQGEECIPGVIRGALDFRDVDHSAKVSDCPSLGWWDVFLDGAVAIKTGVRKTVTTIQDVAVWVSGQCRRSMGALLGIYGPKVFGQLLRDGINDVTDKDWQRFCPGYVPGTGFAGLARAVYQDQMPDPSIPF
jgi:phage replication initiation protein